MSDIVERLLDHTKPATETPTRYTIRRNEERAEAAAEITRLRALADEAAKVLEPFIGDNWTTLSPGPESVAAARALYVRLRGEPKRGET